jgi:zinc transporter 9
MGAKDGESSLLSVTWAIFGNSAVAALKFSAASLTGSSAMFSEAFHSVGDVLNQLVLFVGIKRGTKRSDRRFPFGRGKERYGWNLVAIMIVGFLGGITAFHGFQSIVHGHIPDYLEEDKVILSVGAVSLSLFWIVQLVLGASLVIEGYTLWVAKKVVWKQKGKKSLWEYVQESSDPTGYSVLFEDSVAVLGVSIAAAGIWLTVGTGNPVFDGIAAMCISALMLGSTLFLGRILMALISGRSSAKLEGEMEQFIKSHPSVEQVHRISTEIRGAGIISADVWVEFKEEAIFHHISTDESRTSTLRTPHTIVEATYAHVTGLLDTLRQAMKERFPELEFLCVEPEFPRSVLSPSTHGT